MISPSVSTKSLTKNCVDLNDAKLSKTSASTSDSRLTVSPVVFSTCSGLSLEADPPLELSEVSPLLPVPPEVVEPPWDPSPVDDPSELPPVLVPLLLPSVVDLSSSASILLFGSTSAPSNHHVSGLLPPSS